MENIITIGFGLKMTLREFLNHLFCFIVFVIFVRNFISKIIDFIYTAICLNGIMCSKSAEDVYSALPEYQYKFKSMKIFLLVDTVVLVAVILSW